ncbi:MAG: DUF2064 domain-containing protein [Flavobacteriaceae bacterium]|nr:DUF2064 domain-containing protein [Flavobacteriaceae bacterium]
MSTASPSKTAILIFANSAETESARKVLGSGCNKGLQQSLFEKLNERTVRTVQKTGLPYLIYTEKEQVGNSFGERFTRAIQDVFSKGYERVIAIGNDSPELTSNQILKAYSALRDGKFVLGPSCDGGFYLMGIDRDSFLKTDFIKFSWQQKSLFIELIDFAHDAHLSVEKLSTLADLDRVEDLKKHGIRWIQKLKSLREILLSINFEEVFPNFIFTKHTLPLCHIQISFNKGSPIFIF